MIPEWHFKEIFNDMVSIEVVKKEHSKPLTIDLSLYPGRSEYWFEVQVDGVTEAWFDRLEDANRFKRKLKRQLKNKKGCQNYD